MLYAAIKKVLDTTNRMWYTLSMVKETEKETEKVRKERIAEKPRSVLKLATGNWALVDKNGKLFIARPIGKSS